MYNQRNDYNNDEPFDGGINFSWEKFLRIAGFIAAIFMWFLSMKFSADGFGDTVSQDVKWLGYGLAACFTILQLVWNKMRDGNRNFTIWIYGILVYAYSVFTDIVGLSQWIGHANLFSAPIATILIVFALSGLVEMVPEPLIIWSVSGSFGEGDFLGNLLGKRIGYQQSTKANYREGNHQNNFRKSNNGGRKMGFQQQPAMRNSSSRPPARLSEGSLKKALSQRLAKDKASHFSRNDSPFHQNSDDDEMDDFLRN